MNTQEYYDSSLNAVLKQVKEVTDRKYLSDNNAKEWLLEVQREINKSLNKLQDFTPEDLNEFF